jgi:hypothetical protein
MEKIVADLPDGFDSNQTVLFIKDGDGFRAIPTQVREVKVKKTDEEKRRHKRIYRKKYVSQPHVQEKIKAHLADPIVAAQRKAYAARPDVKNRKKFKAQEARAVRRQLKEVSRYLRSLKHDDDCPVRFRIGVMNCDWCNV